MNSNIISLYILDNTHLSLLKVEHRKERYVSLILKLIKSLSSS